MCCYFHLCLFAIDGSKGELVQITNDIWDSDFAPKIDKNATSPFCLTLDVKEIVTCDVSTCTWKDCFQPNTIAKYAKQITTSQSKSLETQIKILKEKQSVKAAAVCNIRSANEFIYFCLCQFFAYLLKSENIF